MASAAYYGNIQGTPPTLGHKADMLKSLCLEWDSIRSESSSLRDRTDNWMRKLDSLTHTGFLPDVDLQQSHDGESCVLPPAFTSPRHSEARCSSPQASPRASSMVVNLYDLDAPSTSLQKRSDYQSSNAIPEDSEAYQAAIHYAKDFIRRSSIKRKANQGWIGQVRIRMEEFESNSWCRGCLLLFIVALVAYDYSEVCYTSGWNLSDLCYAGSILSLMGNIFFTVEVFIYLTVYPWWFLCKSSYFWIDFLAILTFYIRVIGGWRRDENALIEFLTICIPTFRLLKITRRSKSWRLLVMAMKGAVEPICVPVLFSTLIVTIASGLLYWADKYTNTSGDKPGFTSLSHALWFSVVTISTTGYGDVVPQSVFGKFLCVILISVGVCCWAMPLAVVGNCFCSVWEQRDVILLTDKLKALFSVVGMTFSDLKQLFDTFDLDASGELELEEFIVFFRLLNLDIGRREAAKFFQMIDIDKTGKVSFDEFQECLEMFEKVDDLPPSLFERHVSIKNFASVTRRSQDNLSVHVVNSLASRPRSRRSSDRTSD